MAVEKSVEEKVEKIGNFLTINFRKGEKDEDRK